MSAHESVELKLPGKTTITSENYASIAESVISGYMASYDKKRTADKLTTSKLRGIYSLIMNLYVKAGTPEEYERYKDDVQYLKVRMAYEIGRDKDGYSHPLVDFMGVTHLMGLIDSVMSFEQFRLYCRYAEALVAYFKFFGGKDS